MFNMHKWNGLMGFSMFSQIFLFHLFHIIHTSIAKYQHFCSLKEINSLQKIDLNKAPGRGILVIAFDKPTSRQAFTACVHSKNQVSFILISYTIWGIHLGNPHSFEKIHSRRNICIFHPSLLNSRLLDECRTFFS
jgi:hypothetical protein